MRKYDKVKELNQIKKPKFSKSRKLKNKRGKTVNFTFTFQYIKYFLNDRLRLHQNTR